MTYKPTIAMSKNDRFVRAASKGDMPRLMNFMNNNLNYKPASNMAALSGKTALHAGSIAGNLSVVQFLLEHGAEIDASDSRGFASSIIFAR